MDTDPRVEAAFFDKGVATGAAHVRDQALAAIATVGKADIYDAHEDALLAVRAEFLRRIGEGETDGD